MTNQAWCYQTALARARDLLNHPQAKLEAEILLSHSLQVERTRFYTWPEQALTNAQAQTFFALVERRMQGEPIAYIIGHREFWGLKLKVSPATLIPRADTETLVEVALAKMQTLPQPKVLDLGTGSGAIALALASERADAEITAVDISAAALEIAQQNAVNLKLHIELLQGAWFEPINPQQTFDLIVSNPPYIEQQDPHLQQGDLRFEPENALASGMDGLDDIRLIIHQAWCFLQPKGWLVIEHGYNQAQAMHDLFEQQGYQALELVHDLAGQPRVTLGQKP